MTVQHYFFYSPKASSSGNPLSRTSSSTTGGSNAESETVRQEEVITGCNCLQEPEGLHVSLRRQEVALRLNDSLSQAQEVFRTFQCMVAHHQFGNVRKNVLSMKLTRALAPSLAKSEHNPLPLSEGDQLIHGTIILLKEYEQQFGENPFEVEGIPSGEWEACLHRHLEVLNLTTAFADPSFPSILSQPIMEARITELPDIRMLKRIGKLVQVLMDPAVATEYDGNVNVQIPSAYLPELNRDGGARMQLYLRCRTAAVVMCNSFVAALMQSHDPEVRERARNGDLKFACEGQIFSWIVSAGQSVGSWEPDLGRTYFTLAFIFAALYQAKYRDPPFALANSLSKTYGEGHRAATAQCAQFQSSLLHSQFQGDHRIARDPKLLPACSAALRAMSFLLTLVGPYPGVIYPRSEEGGTILLRRLVKAMYGTTPFGHDPELQCLDETKSRHLDEIVKQVLHTIDIPARDPGNAAV